MACVRVSPDGFRRERQVLDWRPSGDETKRRHAEVRVTGLTPTNQRRLRCRPRSIQLWRLRRAIPDPCRRTSCSTRMDSSYDLTSREHPTIDQMDIYGALD
jgi:hypothetical protein